MTTPPQPPPAVTRAPRRHVIRIAALLLGLALGADRASAQWTRVTALPAANTFSVRATGDTVLAGSDGMVFVSTDGVAWRPSTRLVAGHLPVFALWTRGAALFAGTADQGVFASTDLGASWVAFNQGLVGGLFDSQLHISDLEVRGDSLYVATLGAGVYVRPLSTVGAWSPFGAAFELDQAANVNDLALGGTRLLACAGSNGTAFFRDPGDAEWTESLLGNLALLPGLSSHSSLWTGRHWVLGCGKGVLLSDTGREPWTPSDTNLSGAGWTTFARVGDSLFAALDFQAGALLVLSLDDGRTWTLEEVWSGVFVYQLAARGADLYAARDDGLWVRSAAALAVPAAVLPGALRFALAGPQPCGDRVRLRFELPAAANAAIEVLDVQGRVAVPAQAGAWSAGAHELQLDLHALPPGVYLARISARGEQAIVRLVRAR